MRGRVPEYLQRHVKRIEAYQRESVLDTYRLTSGEQVEADHSIHERFRDLNDGRLLMLAIDAGDRDYARALANFYFASELVDAGDRLRKARRELTTTFNGTPARIGTLIGAWSSSSDATKRTEIVAAVAPLLRRRADAERAWVDAHGDARRALGFQRHADLITALEGDVTYWVRHAEEWLAGTRERFLREWRTWCERDHLSGNPFTPWLAEVPTLSPGARDLVTAGQQTATAWGYQAIVDRVPIDVEPRPGRSPVSLCARIAPPQDVRVTTHSSRAAPAYGVLLHEFGHALHFSVGPDRPFDLFGDHQAITEGFGMTFQHVATQPRWFERFAGESLDQEKLARLRFLEQIAQRLDATHVLYELAVHSGSVDPPQEFMRLYAREFEVEIDPALAYFRMQLFLEFRTFYPLYLHQAHAIGAVLWDKLAGVADTPDWYVSDRPRGYLDHLFKRSCEVSIDRWFEVIQQQG